MSSVLASATPRSAPRVTSAHQAKVASLEAGLTTREMISAIARSRCRPGGDQLLALQARVDQVDDVVRQRGDVGHGLVLDRPGLPVGAAQVGRGVVPGPALLVDVTGLLDSDYVHLADVPR